MGPRLLTVVVSIAFAGAVQAEPARVQVRTVPGRPLPPELLDTLRIHLDGVAVVDAGAPLTGDTLAHRIEDASGGLAAGGLVTWLENGPDDRSYVVVVVGERDGRAAVEVGRLDGTDASAISRLLALRVGAFLDETIAAGSRSPVAAPSPPPPRIAARAGGGTRDLGVVAEIGGGGEADGDGWHSEGALAIGVRQRRAAHQIDLVAIGRLGWPRNMARDDGEVRIEILDLALGMRASMPLRGVWLGAGVELGARRVHANAMETQGAAGAAVRWLPRVRVALDAGGALSPAVRVRAGLGLERGLEVEQFTVHGQTVAEVGALAAVGGVWLSFPLGRQ